jgi:formylglycine-generating enzyme required for sulfatase activity
MKRNGLWILSAGIHLKIIRGGSFSSPPEDARSAVRLGIPPGSRSNLGLGFRLAMQH